MNGTLRSDVLILGAGPGGCAAALALSRMGVEALMVDRAVFPRDKVCGDALSGKVMRTLERVLPGAVEELRADARQMPSRGVTFTAPNGRSLRVPFSRGPAEGPAPGAIMPRLDFDDWLLRHARSARGITFLDGTAIQNFERTDGGWTVRAADDTVAIDCRIIIVADGANSSFARHVAGIPMEPRHHCAGVRAYFTGVTGLDPQGFIELIFLKELLPGYLWIFPLPGGRANVGLGLRSDVVRRRRADLKALLKELIATHPELRDRFAGARMDGAIQGLGLPLAGRRWPLSGDGYLLVGDAGHLIDPFTGEGISHAMISGLHAAEVAAQVLSAGDPPVAARMAAYDARVWRRLGKELSISFHLQRLAAHPWLFNFVVGRAMRNPVVADTISSMFNDLDLRDRLRKPSFYARLLFG